MTEPTTTDQDPEAANRTIDEQAARVAYVIHNTRAQAWPFPHLQMELLLPPSLYEPVSALDIGKEALATHVYGADGTQQEQHRFSLNYTGADLKEDRVTVPELARIYRVLSHGFIRHAFFTVFEAELKAKFAKTPITIDTSFSYIEDSTGYELLPHTDSETKVITLLIYLARDGDNPELGTQLYLPRDTRLYDTPFPAHARHRPQGFYPVCTLPFRANAALAFAPSRRTFHGVPPVLDGQRTRRLMQFQFIARPAAKPPQAP